MEKTLSSGEIILRREDISPFLFSIVSGKVRIEKNDNIHYLSEGDFFGEEGAVLKKPAEYTAIAGDETVLALFKDEALEEFFSKNPEKAIRMVHKNIALSYDMSADFSDKSPAYIKLLNIISQFVPEKVSGGDDKIKLSVSLMTLAEKMEMSIPSVRVLLWMSESFGDIRLSEDSNIYSSNLLDIKRKIVSINLRRFFCDENKNRKGKGHFNLSCEFENL